MDWALVVLPILGLVMLAIVVMPVLALALVYGLKSRVARLEGAPGAEQPTALLALQDEVRKLAWRIGRLERELESLSGAAPTAAATAREEVAMAPEPAAPEPPRERLAAAAPPPPTEAIPTRRWEPVAPGPPRPPAPPAPPPPPQPPGQPETLESELAL